MPDGSLGYVLFRLGGEMYGLPIERVQSIIRYERGTPVPKAPPSVEGVINLRGRVIPVVDLAMALGRGSFEPEANSRIVVAETSAGLVGLAVDAAHEVLHIDPSSIQPPPGSVLEQGGSDAIAGVTEHNGRLALLLDLERTIPKGELATVAETASPEEGGHDG